MRQKHFFVKTGFNLLFLFLISGCTSFVRPEIKGIQDISIKQIGLQNIELDALVVVDNRNNQSIKIDAAEFEVYLNENKIGNLLLKEPVTIDSKTDANCPCKLIIDSQVGMKLGIKSLKKLNSGELKIRLKGTISGRFGIFKRKIMVDEEL
jgi:LEA14-like dessication related protein